MIEDKSAFTEDSTGAAPDSPQLDATNLLSSPIHAALETFIQDHFDTTQQVEDLYFKHLMSSPQLDARESATIWKILVEEGDMSCRHFVFIILPIISRMMGPVFWFQVSGTELPLDMKGAPYTGSNNTLTKRGYLHPVE